MKRYFYQVVLVVFAAAALAFATSSAPQAASTQDSNAPSLPAFPYSNGWLGADDAYSVPLTSTKSLWLFGDTFVGDPDTTLRNKSKTMARNSIGISTCEPDKPCTMQYFWRHPQSPQPRSFFDTGTDDVWYWPMDAYRDGDTVYMSAMIVRNKKGMGPNDPFGFEIVGTRWIVIHNVLADPSQWKFDAKKLTDGDLWVGTSTFPDGAYVLFYTQVSEGEGKGYMTVLRAPRDKLADPSKVWEYLGRDNKWHSGTPHGNAKSVIDQPISEMSVRYHPSVKKWVAISGGPEFPSNRIVVRTSDSPIGPWSSPRTVFEFPEMKHKNPIYDKDTFCYATKEHTEFGDTKLVVTYACNSFSVAKVKEKMELYRPQVVVLDIPK